MNYFQMVRFLLEDTGLSNQQHYTEHAISIMLKEMDVGKERIA